MKDQRTKVRRKHKAANASAPQIGDIFENEWQSFRTRQDRDLELKTAIHVYPKSGRYVVAVKVIDIFGNDTMTLVPISVG